MAIHLNPINWRLLALHLLGIPFLVLGMQELFLIRHVWFIQLALRYGTANVGQHIPAGYSGAQLISELYLREPLAAFVAIVLACVLLSSIVWRRRESWLLPLLLFVGGVVLNWSQLYSLSFVQNLPKVLHGSLEAPTAQYRLAVVGLLLLAIGLLPFLYTWRKPVAPATVPA
ncbi:hypothetical protein KBK19_04325 [Microvirga sp. STR05]|uniref:Uncharacterized protein n=2 Tax=Hymenobacter TaxID=89966 RepID=A0A7G7W8Q2_9BACT|nr:MULTISPECIES: hypothetical protein [Hymenobacter]MBD2714255.1 hypothetical protein [Hymenobacter duratus]MBR7949158.1 hypothetical protein [Microvirga sp. STR05]QNH62745.1 hypothetical protein H4317_02665 [Hymenobacter sediminicola]